MPTKILMPALSPTMTEGTLAKWLKKEGDNVNPGDVIAEIETDKATMEVESVDEGVLAKIIIPEQTEDVKINTVIAVILEEGETKNDLEEFIKTLPKESDISKASKENIKNIDAIEDIENSNKAGISVQNENNVEPVITEIKRDNIEANNDPKIHNNQKIFASPLAKRLAKNLNISLINISGTGPRGRIIKRDIDDYQSQGNNNIKRVSYQRNQEEYKLVKLNNIRKVIAKRLTESKQEIPHFYLNQSCNLDKLVWLRTEINSYMVKKGEQKISVNDFIIKASACALSDIPEVNSGYSKEGILHFNNVDISVAVSANGNLITPIIKNANYKSITDISREMKELVIKAKENKLKPEEFQGGSFSISNLGMFGTESFSAVINPPQSSILAVGAMIEKPIVKDNKIQISNMLSLTLSCDHRVVDGELGARFLSKVKEYLESPIELVNFF